MTPPNSEQRQSSTQWMDEWPISRRSILQTGTIASGTLAYGGAIGLAGAQPGGKGNFPERVPVIDSEDPDPDPAIVINNLDIPISGWKVYGSETVADQNPTYDPDDQVIIVAFEDLLDSGWPDWRRAKPNTLFDGVIDRGIKFHAFPKTRLKKARPNRGRNSR